jgi:hypothetical protein
MDSAAAIYYWVRFGAVVLVALLALISALRRSKARRTRRDLFFGIAGLVVLAVAVVLGVPVNFMLAGGLLVVGVILGFAAGGVRPLTAWLTAISVVFATIMLLFGAPGAVGMGVAVLAFGVGMPLGQGLRRRPKKAASAEPPAATPVPVG